MMNRVGSNVIYCESLKLAFGAALLQNETSSIWEKKVTTSRVLLRWIILAVGQSETGSTDDKCDEGQNMI